MFEYKTCHRCCFRLRRKCFAIVGKKFFLFPVRASTCIGCSGKSDEQIILAQIRQLGLIDKRLLPICLRHIFAYFQDQIQKTTIKRIKNV